MDLGVIQSEQISVILCCFSAQELEELEIPLFSKYILKASFFYFLIVSAKNLGFSNLIVDTKRQGLK